MPEQNKLLNGRGPSTAVTEGTEVLDGSIRSVKKVFIMRHEMLQVLVYTVHTRSGNALHWASTMCMVIADQRL